MIAAAISLGFFYLSMQAPLEISRSERLKDSVVSARVNSSFMSVNSACDIFYSYDFSSLEKRMPLANIKRTKWSGSIKLRFQSK